MAKSKGYLRKKQNFSGAQVLLFVMAFTAVGAVAVWQTLAKGKPASNSGTISLVMVTDKNGDGAPNWGDTISFNVATTVTTEPHVQLKCSQNGVLVYSAETGYYATYPWPWTQNMTLSSSAWPNGAADCTATLGYLGNKGNRPAFIAIRSINFQVKP